MPNTPTTETPPALGQPTATQWRATSPQGSTPPQRPLPFGFPPDRLPPPAGSHTPLPLPQALPQGLPPQALPPGFPQGLPPGFPQGLPPGFPQGLPQGLPQGFPQGSPPGLPPNDLLHHLMTQHHQHHRAAILRQQQAANHFTPDYPFRAPTAEPSAPTSPPLAGPNATAAAPDGSNSTAGPESTRSTPAVNDADGTRSSPATGLPNAPQFATVRVNHSTIAMPRSTGAFPIPQGFPGLPGGPYVPNPLFREFHSQPQAQAFDPTASTIYLLSSPQGPHALLFSPQGTYTSNINPAHSQLRPTPTTTQAPDPQAAQAQAQAPQPQPIVVDANRDPQQVAQQVLQQINQADNQQFDALAPWQPILAQGWLLLRMLLFAWLFLGTGQGWRRPLVLLAIGVVFWIVNNGAFGTNIREAVRGWWEGVVGLPARNAQPEGQAEGAQPAPPRQEEVQRSWIREALRPIERALALFLASLWPGIGERTVAARREEENRIRREGEARRRQEDEERQRQLEAAAAEEPVAIEEQAGATGAEVDGADGARERRVAGASGGQVQAEGEASGSQMQDRHQSTLAADW